MATNKIKMSELKKIIKEELQGVMEADPTATAQPAALKEGDYIIFDLKDLENAKFVAKVEKIESDGTMVIGPSMLSPGLTAVAPSEDVRKATPAEINNAI